MKRKLISYDVFESIQTNSLSTAEHELLEAEAVLAKALELEGLNLVCYGSDSVLYETAEGNYVHSNYELGDNHIAFENIEQLVIDEETEQVASKKNLTNMLDALLDGNDAKANQLFDEFINLPNYKRDLNEGVSISASASTGHGRKSPFRGKHRAGGHAAAMKAARTRKKHARLISPSMKNRMNRLRDLESHKLGGRTLRTGKGQRSVRTYLRFKTSGEKAKHMREWSNLLENVFAYVDFKEYGSILKESVASFDDKGNVSSIKIPNYTARNEAKMLSFNWKTMDTDVKVLRSGAKTLAENNDFCKAVAILKRQNALSDSAKTQEALEDIVDRWPAVLYLTHNEMASTVADALSAVAAVNYDDQTCEFMAEAILRTAHDIYVDRVAKIVTLSGAAVDESEDKYVAFKDIADNFFPHLDESNSQEMQVYVDLYEALRNLYNIAADDVKKETANHLNELAAIIEQQVEPSMEVAIAAAEWLNDLVETNLESGEWSISNSVHTTVNGDHPDMAKKAKQSYAPSSDFSGDYGDTAPVSDGKSYRNGLANQMRNNSYGNLGGEGTYPSLQNPYVPKPFGDYKIAGEKSIENDSDLLGHAGGSDTWPSLQNPYVPSAETPQTYKMNGGKEKDLIVDK